MGLFWLNSYCIYHIKMTFPLRLNLFFGLFLKFSIGYFCRQNLFSTETNELIVLFDDKRKLNVNTMN